MHHENHVVLHRTIKPDGSIEERYEGPAEFFMGQLTPASALKSASSYQHKPRGEMSVRELVNDLSREKVWKKESAFARGRRHQSMLDGVLLNDIQLRAAEWEAIQAGLDPDEVGYRQGLGTPQPHRGFLDDFRAGREGR